MHDPPFLTACHAVYTHACMVIELIEVRSLDLLQLDTHIPDHRCIMHATVPCHQCNMGRLYNASTHHACFIQYIFTLLFMVLQKVCACVCNQQRPVHACTLVLVHLCMHAWPVVRIASLLQQTLDARRNTSSSSHACHSPPRSINIYIRGHLSSDASQLLHNKLMPMGLFLS